MNCATHLKIPHGRQAGLARWAARSAERPHERRSRPQDTRKRASRRAPPREPGCLTWRRTADGHELDPQRRIRRYRVESPTATIAHKARDPVFEDREPVCFVLRRTGAAAGLAARPCVWEPRRHPVCVPFGDCCEAIQQTFRGLAYGECCSWRSAARAGPQPVGWELRKDLKDLERVPSGDCC
jgi:hypothetical protein